MYKCTCYCIGFGVSTVIVIAKCSMLREERIVLNYLFDLDFERIYVGRREPIED